MPSTSNPSTGNHNLSTGARKRVYRANAGSNAAYFQLVADVPYTTTSITDNTASSALAEVLPSEGWIGPPDDNISLYPDGPMEGLIPVGNGVFCGFAGTRLCFRSLFLPHAWPIQYRITIENEIVGISATNNGVIVMTTGFPYFRNGYRPSGNDRDTSGCCTVLRQQKLDSGYGRVCPLRRARWSSFSGKYHGPSDLTRVHFSSTMERRLLPDNFKSLLV